MFMFTLKDLARKELIIFSIGSDNVFAPAETTSHHMNKRRSVYWRIYASLGFNELKNIVDPVANSDLGRIW